MNQSLSQKPGPSSFRLLGLACLAVAGLLLCILSGRAAQRPPLPTVRGFKAPARYPAKPGQPERVQSMIFGDSATPRLDGRIIIDGLRIELYPNRDRPPTNLIAKAAQCVFDRNTETAFSSNRLQVASGDGRLTIEGTGFLWRQTNASLIISNEVHTLIRDEPPVNVVAQHFEYDGFSRRAIYREQVKAWDPQMEITSDLLELKVPEPGQPLESIVARQNVVMIGKQDNSRATGEQAEYMASTNQQIIELTGHPTWQQGLRQGQAERIRFDRLSRAYHAEGNTYTRLPGSDMEQPGALLPSVTATTNAPANTNQFVEIVADVSDIQTNGAVFRGHVRVKETQAVGPPAYLAGEVLTLKFGSPEGKLESLAMQESVMIEQGESQITAAAMLYAKTNGVAEFTGNPAWKMGPREGSAQVIRFLLGQEPRVLQARDQARMKLPLDTNSFALGLSPSIPTNSVVSPVATNLPAATLELAPKLVDTPPTSNTNRFLIIESDGYDLQPGLVTFQGQPRLTEFQNGTPHSTLRCNELTSQLSVPGNRLEAIEADGQVCFEQGTPGVTNGPATYQKLTAEHMVLSNTNELSNGIVLIARQDVALHYGDFLATGRRLVYSGNTETVELTGEPDFNPVVTNPRGKLSSPVIIWDRRLNRFLGGLGWTGQFDVKSSGKPTARRQSSAK